MVGLMTRDLTEKGRVAARSSKYSEWRIDNTCFPLSTREVIEGGRLRHVPLKATGAEFVTELANLRGVACRRAAVPGAAETRGGGRDREVVNGLDWGRSIEVNLRDAPRGGVTLEVIEFQPGIERRAWWGCRPAIPLTDLGGILFFER
jgi:hypothetical protein